MKWANLVQARMVSAKIVNYIEKNIDKISRNEIVNNLLKVGINSKSIDSALKKIENKRKLRKIPILTRAKKRAKKTFRRTALGKPHKKEKIIGGAKILPTDNINQELLIKKYIHRELAKNIPINKIRVLLLKSGWKKEKIDTLLSDYTTQPIVRNAQKIVDDTLILTYVQKSLAKNISKDEIRQNLLNRKWSTDQIEKIFEKINQAQIQEGKVPIETKIDEKRIRKDSNIKIHDEYFFNYMDIKVNIIIYAKKEEATKFYHMIIPVISSTTNLILEEIRLKLIDQINLGTLEIAEGNFTKLDQKVQDFLIKLVTESFPHVDSDTHKFLVSFLISRILGLGIVEIIKADEQLEEIVINNSSEPIYTYHKKWGWCKSNQILREEGDIIHLADMTGRKIGREITNLTPLLDAHLSNGDRINATIKPITPNGPTITIRKFSTDPWTITKFLQTKTIDYNMAALLWLAIQYELSILVVGGTASGKTSALNVLTGFIPPDQRIISIEDTREIRLPKYSHWIPMSSREPNPEGKGGVEMSDLLVNSLRMRPDRIIVGEVRKQIQAETLFEAIHTGHSCYATFHANNAEETIIRLTNPPISVPKTMMPAVSLLLVQFRNRRTGKRRTFQVAEITKDGGANVIFQYNPRDDKMIKANESSTFFATLELYTGNTMKQLNTIMAEKITVLKYLVKNNLTRVEEVGKVMSAYYINKDHLLKEIIAKNKLLK